MELGIIPLILNLSKGMSGMVYPFEWFDKSDFVATLDVIGAHHERARYPIRVPYGAKGG